jgi:phenylpropionate dioxygenase-like ring-hydroxylating dioxygenase large terminal subunit
MADGVNSNPEIVDLKLMHPEVGKAHTLPSRFYLEPSLLEQEKKAIFWQTWQVIGYREQVAKPGDYFTFDLVGEPLLVVRDTENKLRGYYNVCRHRAGPPAEGCGSRKVFRCGYHGWTYSLDGRLLNAPEMDGVCDFRHEDFSLRPVHVAEWGGMVFVNLDPRAESLQSWLGDIPEKTAKFGLERLKFFRRKDYVMECNWKTYIDNYMEGYHLPSVHPSLNRELDYSAYEVTLFDNYSLQTSPIRGPENEATVERRYKQREGNMAAEYYWIYPNWMLNCYPDNMSLNVVLPLGPEKCVALFFWFFEEERMKCGVPETTFNFSDEIQMEDGHICEVVQRNLRSQSYDRGRYSVKQEKSLHHFHRRYLASISETPARASLQG